MVSANDARHPRRPANLLAGGVVALAFVLLCAGAWPAIVRADPVLLSDDAYKLFYRSFADTSCCWTNKCCYEIAESEVEDLGGGVTLKDTSGRVRTGHGYRIKASGQVVLRTGFSPDGRYYRCACDLANTGWRVWPGANTRCLFTPPFGS